MLRPLIQCSWEFWSSTLEHDGGRGEGTENMACWPAGLQQHNVYYYTEGPPGYTQTDEGYMF